MSDDYLIRQFKDRAIEELSRIEIQQKKMNKHMIEMKNFVLGVLLVNLGILFFLLHQTGFFS